MRRVLHPIRIDQSHKGWIGEPCKPKRRKEDIQMWNMRIECMGKGGKTCIIGALLWRDMSWSWTEGMWVCWHGCVAVVQLSWSYKAEGGQSCFDPTTHLLPSQRLCPLLAMSLINNRTFERSMGHQISCQDARFHLHTSDGQHYLSNQQVRHRQDSALWVWLVRL